MEGFVESFDEVVGLGRVRGKGGRQYCFHCTEIVDGSRTIPVGARVDFVVVPGHGGVWEAAQLSRRDGAEPAGWG